jgi:Flp pilus assembly protein TadG
MSKASEDERAKIGHLIATQLRTVRGLLQRMGKASLRRVRRWNRASGEEGSALVEFALTAPLLLTFFFGLIEVSMAIYTHQVISETAREGTRYAMVHGSTCVNGSGAACTLTASAVNSYVAAIPWPNIGGGATTINTTYPDGNEAPGSRVQVNITYAFPFRVPFVPTSTLTMQSTSVMYIVQ